VSGSDSIRERDAQNARRSCQIQTITKMTNEKMRFEAAKAAMQGLLTNPYWDGCDFGKITKAAVNAADCLLQAFYPSTEESSTVADSEGWIAHKPGDPMPCDEDLMVWVRFADGIQDKYNHAGFWKGVDGSVSFWDECGDATIIAWKPSKLTAVEILNQFVKP
jgi:hypothetical protein